MTPIRALVVGLGSIGQRHARNLRAILGDDLVLAALRSDRRAPVVTNQLKATAGDPAADCDGGVYTRLDEALSTKPDVVVVSNPTSLHVPVAMAALRAGAAVFLEKPVSDDLAGAVDLAAYARAEDLVVAVGCQIRFHPALRTLRDLLERRVLGPLIAVRAEQAEYLPSFHPYEDYRTSYAARAELGGGVVLTQIHEIDYLQWLFGAPRSVFAVGGHLSGLEIDVEDSASCLFSHTAGGRPLAVHLHVDYLQQVPRRRCVVTGEAGRAEVDLRAHRLTWQAADGSLQQDEKYEGFDRSTMFEDEMRHFLAAARREHPAAVSIDEGVQALRSALAVRESLVTGQLVHLR